LVRRILDVGSPQSDAALESFSGAVQALNHFGLSQTDIMDYFNATVSIAPDSLGRVIRWTPYVAGALRQSGILPTDILDVLLTFAEQAKTIPDMAVHTFVGTVNRDVRDRREQPFN